MKAVRVHEYDRAPTLDEVADPVINGPHDVIIKVEGAGVCRTDLHIVEGQWRDKSGVQLPYTIGHANEKWPGRRAGQIAATRAVTSSPGPCAGSS